MFLTTVKWWDIKLWRIRHQNSNRLYSYCRIWIHCALKHLVVTVAAWDVHQVLKKNHFDNVSFNSTEMHMFFVILSFWLDGHALIFHHWTSLIPVNVSVPLSYQLVDHKILCMPSYIRCRYWVNRREHWLLLVHNQEANA